MAPQSTALVTAEEFERLPHRYAELVRGRVVVHEPPGDLHGAVVGKLTYLLGAFVFPRKLGVVYGETGFRIESNPDSVRAPDVAFLSVGRRVERPARGFGAFAPDLAVEVLSPGDRPGEWIAKVAQWLNAGVRLVWVIDAERRSAQMYGADGSVAIVPSDASLDGGDVLPGFSCELSAVFERLPQT